MRNPYLLLEGGGSGATAGCAGRSGAGRRVLREGLKSGIESLSDEDLDRPGSEEEVAEPPYVTHDEAVRERLRDALFRPFFERWGNEETQFGTIKLGEMCFDVLQEQEFADIRPYIDHIGGGRRKDQKIGEYLSEIYNKHPDAPKGSTKGSSYADLTLEYKKGERRERVNFNTIDTLSDGKTPTKRESRQIKAFEEVHEQIIRVMYKFKKGMDINKVEEDSKEVCREGFRVLQKKLREIEEDTEDKDGDPEGNR